MKNLIIGALWGVWLMMFEIAVWYHFPDWTLFLFLAFVFTSAVTIVISEATDL